MAKRFVEKIRITKEEYDKIELSPFANHIFVKVNKPNKEYKRGNIYTHGDDTGDLALHYYAQRYGVVDKVPKGLYFDKNNNKDIVMKWNTPLEVQEGDEVWFRINSIIYNVYEIEGVNYILMHYRELTARRREGEDLFPLNSYLVYKKLYKNAESKYDYIQIKDIPKAGIVTHVGSDIREFSDEISTRMSNFSVKVGDKILMRTDNHQHLEQINFSHYDSNNEYFIVQKRFLNHIY